MYFTRPLRAQRWRSLIALVAMGACQSPSTQVLLVMDTDADRARPMSVEVRSFRGRVRPSEIHELALRRVDGIARFERTAEGVGSFEAGGSIGVLPTRGWTESAAADRAVVTLWIRTTFAGTDRSPEVQSDRVAQVSFLRNRTGTARVFMPLRCGDRSVGCSSVAPSQCTVSVRCREQNATCGDQGECVSPELAVNDGLDAGVDDAATVDATTGRAPPGDVAAIEGGDAIVDAPADASAVIDAGLDSAMDATDDGAMGDGAATDATVDASVACDSAARTRCGGDCVDLATSVDHCGACDRRCPATANGNGVCVSSSCALLCDPGFALLAGQCVPVALAPRPIAPLSLGETTLRRPTFRWQTPAPFDGSTVEFCRDRGCSSVIETVRTTMSSARPSADLPASSVVFWRVRGRIGAVESTVNSPTWLAHIPAVDASSGVDASGYPHADFNGDGFDDVAVGAPNADPAGNADAGAVHLFYGYPPGVTTAPMRVLNGASAGDNFGFAVAGAGDLNGDGYAELVVGAYHADPAGRSNAGGAWVYLGSPTGISSTPLWVLDGEAVDDLFGYTVAGGGDLDGDGYAELLVGAVSGSARGGTRNGATSVFRGSAAGIPRVPSLVLGGNLDGDGFGVSVSTAGDVNADGFNDVIIGAWSADLPGRADAGSASVFHGSASGLSIMPALVLEGVNMTEYFGRTIAGAGDVNNDGYSDVLVGAYYADFMTLRDAGTTGLYLGGPMGVSAAAARVIGGGAALDYLGISTSSAGDLNGDGFDDVVMGAYFADPGGRNQAGHVQVFYGNAMGIAAVADRVLDGVAVGDLFGVSMCPAGDVNGDGFADVLIGASQADPMGRANAGAASLFFGAAAGVSATPAFVLGGAAAGDGFGYGVARNRFAPSALRMRAARCGGRRSMR